ncbi:hypothetical protein SPFM1_00280 [Salmonella phage SPFM1]|nr:hypothetical protein SPFM1_00280 [Salmonella phage SPFM1]
MQAPAQTQPIVGIGDGEDGLVEYVDKITGGKNTATAAEDLLNWIFRRYGVGGQLPYPELTGIENMSLAENSVRAKYIIQVDVIATVGETQMYKMIDYTSLITVDGEPSLSDETEYIRRDDADNSKLLFTIPALLNTGRFNEETWTAYVGSPFVPLQIVTEAQFRRQGLPLLSGMLDGTNKLKEIEKDLAESQNVCSVFEPTFNGVPLSQMNEQMRFEYRC